MLCSIQHQRQTTIPTSISFDWRRSKDIPPGVILFGPPVALEGKVYVKGRRSKGASSVYVYTPGHDVWDALPHPTVYDFTVATVKDQLNCARWREG